MTLMNWRTACLLILAVLLVDSALANVTVSGGPGSAIDSAIVIIADSSSAGVAAEHSMIKEKFSDWHIDGQTLRRAGSRYFDVFTLTKGEETTVVWFEITSFFGK